MTSYIAREASKLWRRICYEASIEIPLVAENWTFLLSGIIFQYIHGLAARGVHYLHRPGPILQDVGFILLPELGPDKAFVSETAFVFIFLSFLLWTFHPFVFQSKRIYTVLLWCRVLAFLVMLVWPYTFSFFFFLMETLWCRLLNFSGFLRSIQPSFLAQTIIAVRYKCLFQGSELATLPHPETALEVFLINFRRGILYGCGDLIFSSHMIFTLVFVLTYNKYGTHRQIKQFAWLLAVIQSLLIVASHKHYTVDVVVAWYTVILMVFFIDKKLPELPDRTIGTTSASLLPLRTKDIKDKEERHKLFIANSVNIAD